MEKGAGVPKPGDLFIGVIDLFAVLVPGVIAATLIVMAVHATPQTDVLSLSGLLAAGWVLGHVLHGIGSWLDSLLYDPLFRPPDTPPEVAVKHNAFQKYLHKNDELCWLAKAMTDAPRWRDSGPGLKPVPGGMYQWARAWLNSRSPEATANLDRLEADSKLFRSIAVLLLASITLLVAVPGLISIPSGWKVPSEPKTPALLLASTGLLFSLWRYCDLRNKMIRQCYLNYILLRSTPATTYNER